MLWCHFCHRYADVDVIATTSTILWISYAQGSYVGHNRREYQGLFLFLECTLSCKVWVLVGQGYAVRSGMMVARGDFLLFLDADGATRVSDMEKLENELRKKLASGKSDNSCWFCIASVPRYWSTAYVCGSDCHVAPLFVAS
jgi:hypothetical protein